MTSPLLELRQLSCERDERILFSGLDLAVNGGDLLQIIGPNGCGKTTLLRALAGVSSGYRGEIFWCGQPIAKTRWEFACDLLYLGHLPGIKKALTPIENLRWYSSLGKPKPDHQLIDALAQVQLEAYTETPCYQLSAGQLRRVALARLYLNHSPRIWILDEPFTAIDRAGVAQLEQRLQQHAGQGGVVLFTSHQELQLPGLKLLHLADFQSAPALQRQLSEVNAYDR